MKIEGTFQGMDPVQSGVSQAGNPWQKTYFEIITSEGERSRRVAFGAFGNVVEQVKQVPKGAHVEVRFTAESRDYLDKNGQKRYGTDLNCYGLAVITRQTVQPQYAQPQYQQTPPPSGYAPAPQQPQTAPPAPPAQGRAAQPQLQYDDSVSPFQQQPAASADELPPKNYGLPC